MDFTSPSSSPYVSASHSPTGFLKNMHFYSAPTSPMGSTGNVLFFDHENGMSETNEDGGNTFFDDFEFETSRKFDSDYDFEASPKFEWQKQREIGDSFPLVAFADEILCDGQLLPLKLPPRLQHCHDMNYGSNNVILASPRSTLKIPFARRNTWNDDFDPFMVALEKVKEEEKRKRMTGNHDHRRTQSYSPFSTTNLKWSIGSAKWNQHQNKQGSPLQPMQQLGPKPNELMKPKVSTNARWLWNKTQQKRPIPREPTKTKGLAFGRRVGSVKKGQEGATKSGKSIGENGGDCITESRLDKFKGLLLRYASFGRERSDDKEKDNIAAQWKTSYFKRLSFKFKGNGHVNGKKRVSEESKMEVVQYRPTLSLCLGYGSGSPRRV